MPLDWIYGLVGGVLIGCAGAVLLLGNGRIMGASGLIFGIFKTTDRRIWIENLAFVSALFVVPMLFAGPLNIAPTDANENVIVLAIAGLAVGFGTRLANGCTSGHGVCGISRCSLRGIAATMVYILAGTISVVLFKHFLGVI